jgi:ABC-type sulfate/molybdate transport systems ATPase subunit
MLEIRMKLRRGHFHLEVNCRFASEWTVIFGPSGAGKTTILRVLAGLESADEGQIIFNEETLADTGSRLNVKPGRRRTALVAQHPALFPHLSVAANVAYGLAGLDVRSRSVRVEDMLALVDAKDLANRLPRDLSGGEAQRVALARSLAPLPRLLLLDEPFSALDGAASDSLLSRLQHWTSEHRVQTILVTHDATDAFAAGAEVALLREGRIRAQGPAAEVLRLERERMIKRLDGMAN